MNFSSHKVRHRREAPAKERGQGLVTLNYWILVIFGRKT